MGHCRVSSSDYSEEIWEEIEKLSGDAEDAFILISEAENTNVSRPLLILVHPGDSTEEEDDAGHEISADAFDLQESMGAEIKCMVESHDLVVLHRQSSQYGLVYGKKVSHKFIEAIEAVHDQGTVLYGDDLPSASKWLLENMDAAKRPKVFLTGAWSDPKHGCVTAIGEDLLAAGATVEVSFYSPSDHGTIEGGWRPQEHQGPNPS